MWWSRQARGSAAGCRRAGAIAGAVLLLAGCGFRPLYQEPVPAAGSAGVGSELAAVEIAPIPDRVGQLVRNDLLYHMDASEGGGAAAYRLDVRLAESISELAVESTGFATRSNLRLAASYSLVDLSTGRQLVLGRSRAISSYNIVDASFSTLTAQNAARERAAARIAEDIRARLAAYFAGDRTLDPASSTATPAGPGSGPAAPALPPPTWR